MKRILFVILLPLFFSCGQSKKVVIPNDILSKEKMTRVITDIHLAEAEASIHSVPDTSLKTTISFEKIFTKDTLTKEQYEKSLQFYIEHPELLDEVYEQTINELSKMQSEAGKAK